MAPGESHAAGDGGDGGGGNAAAHSPDQQLRDACARGELEAARALLEAGASADAGDEKGKTAMYYAAKSGDVRVLQLLLDRGADLHAVTKKGKSVLYGAAFRGGVAAVRFLLEQGHPIDGTDDYGRTVLFGAAQNGDVDTIQLLLERGVDPHAVAKNKRTALHDAAWTGKIEAVKVLLAQSLAIDSADESGKSVVHYAASGGHIETMWLLMERGADVQAVSDDGRSALHLTAHQAHTESVRFLVEQGLDIDGADTDGDTAFLYASSGGHVDTMRVLMELGADMRARGHNGKTALHYAAGKGHLEAVKFLVEQGLDVNGADYNGNTVFHHAASGGQVETMRLLMELGADVHALGLDGMMAIHWSAKDGHLEALEFLVEQGCDSKAADNDGDTVFHHAASGGQVDIMRLLMKLGADVLALGENGKSALHYAAGKGHLEAVKFLVEQGLDVNGADSNGNTVFHHAASGGQVETMRLLMELGADVRALGQDGMTAMHWAARDGHLEALEVLVEQGCDLDGSNVHAVGKDGWTLLHCAAYSGKEETVIYALGLGLAIDAKADGGETALHRAAEVGNLNTIRLLIEHGADIHATTKKNETALHFGAYGCKIDAVKYLLEMGLSAATTEIDGSTAIHEAAVQGSISTIQLLIEHGGDLHALRENGRSALHTCAENGRCEAATFLVQKGILVNQADEVGITALHEAATKGHIDFMRVLIAHGADPHVLTKAQQNIAHLAVQGGHVDALKYALELGVDVNTRAKVGDESLSPLVLVLRGEGSSAGYTMANVLCSYGASFDATDQMLALNATKSSTTSDCDIGSDTAVAVWRSGMFACVDHWTQEHALGASTLTSVPIEVVNRGEASVKTYLADVARSTYDDRLHRCKICVVGPSEWGKTSLVQSMRTSQTFLTELKDRTIGIDLTTCMLKSVANDAPVRLEVTFWDFAGQDVYQAAHTLFFSQRTLFVLVVDLEKYWKELEDATGKADRVSEAQMNRFVSAKIFRWVRSIFAHQPDAQFVVVGTKVNQLEDAQVVAEIWDDLLDRMDHWKAAFAKGLDRDLVPVGASAKHIECLQSRLSNLATSEWLVSNLLEVDSVMQVREALQNTIISSDLGFPMWKTYRHVLEYVMKLREVAKNASSPRERIEKSIIRYGNLSRQLLRKVGDLGRDACEQIMRTLNDLGDVLWYDHDGAGVLKDYIILDPMLVIEVVREVIRHDFSSHNDGRSPQDGRISHALLSTFPLWKDMEDVELMLAFKALLQHFQLAYPADADVMQPESDIIVPAYWNAERGLLSRSVSMRRSLAPQKSVCDGFALHRWCWEYQIPNELSETIFIQFAVQSYSSFLPRTIRGFCVEAACAEFATSISLIQSDSPRDVLRIEVSGVSAELSWHNMRYYLMKMERVLEAYGGDVIWRSIIQRRGENSAESRHPVGTLVKAIKDVIDMGKDLAMVRAKMPWMPPDMEWFLRKSWNDVSTFQHLQMNQLIQEKLEVLRKLAIAGDTPRHFPALWSLTYIPDTQKVVLRMSSDLSGRCYHGPIEIDTGSPLVARHASIFKAGVSLFATVVGDAVSLPLVKTVVDAAKSALERTVDNAVSVHNLIDKLDMSPSEGFDTRGNKLSPGASMVLLRDLLKAHDDSLDALEISEISNLECAVTSNGEYVWAHTHEIAAMGDKITRRCAPPSSWATLAAHGPDSTNAKASPTSPQRAKVASDPTSKNDASGTFKFSISVNEVVGLSDWDWYKTYCTWQLYYSSKSLTPLAVDVTPTNGDSSQPPSWRTMRMVVDAVASVEMLRECRLAVQVKRRSRIGYTKRIGEGQVWLRDFLDKDADQNFSCEPVRVSLDAKVADRAVIIHIAAET